MSDNFIPNQAVKFNYRDSLCCETEPYCQPVEQDDSVSFQLPNICKPLVQPNWVENGDFSGGATDWSQDSSGNTWAFGSDTAHVTMNSPGEDNSNVLYQMGIFNHPCSENLKLCFTVTGLTGHAATLEIAQRRSDGTLSYFTPVTTDGTYCYDATESSTFTGLAFQVLAASHEDTITVSISNVSVVCPTPIFSHCVTVCIKNQAGDTVTTLSDGHFSYLPGIINVTFKWSDLNLSDGCYTICICDGFFGTNLIIDGDTGTFEASITGWGTDSSYGVFHDNSQSHGGVYSLHTQIVSGMASGTRLFKDTVTLKKNTQYKVSGYVLLGTDAMGASFVKIDVPSAASIDDQIGMGLSHNNTVWNYIETTFTTGTTTSIEIDFNIYAPDINNFVGDIWLDDVNLWEADTYNPCSQIFCLKTKQDCAAIYIEYSNDTNAFGIVNTPAPLLQSMRLTGQVVYSRYQELELDSYQNSAGVTGLLYTKSSKIYELAVMDMPEYMHDALRVALLNRTFQINGISYVKYKGDYLPIKKRNSLNYGVKVEIYEADENTENAVC